MEVKREHYMEQIHIRENNGMVKVITGVRRCGKSILLEIYQDYLKQHGVDEEQIIAINFEDLDYEELTEYK